MDELLLRGAAAAPGIAVAPGWVVPERQPVEGAGGGEVEQAHARAVLERVAAELEREAELLRAAGLVEEAEILDANALMARDPVLASDVDAVAARLPAPAALREATERHAAALDALDDPTLAARAADVRALGRRAERLLDGAERLELPAEPVVLLARDLGPADVADVRDARAQVVGIALADGAVTSHAAIVARGLGVPMVVALGDGSFALAGVQLVLDGDAGTVLAAPQPSSLAHARAAVARQERTRSELAAGRSLPAVTRDGRRVRLLCNATSAAEVRAGLDAGAEGAGLIRTELAFLEARGWPSEAEHRAALEPVLGALTGRVATVRTLDFGEDKKPPFLAADGPRGVALTLAHPQALAAQLRAAVRAGRATELRLLLPLVESPGQVRAVRPLLVEALEPGARVPQLGAMIETPAGAARAAEIAAECDFLSIGTNDLVQYTLGIDRQGAAASARAAAHPAVLRHVEAVCRAAGEAGIAVEVCGEAAGEPEVVPLLVALGVGELSVSPVRLDSVRAAVRASGSGVQSADERSEALDGLGRVRA
jgi:phosphoenolpyruvate-protein kinase (PTS system EI component)